MLATTFKNFPSFQRYMERQNARGRLRRARRAAQAGDAADSLYREGFAVRQFTGSRTNRRKGRDRPPSLSAQRAPAYRADQYRDDIRSAYVSARARGVHELIAADDQSHIRGTPRFRFEEHEVARFERVPADVEPLAELLVHGSRHGDAVLAEDVPDEAAAVES